MDNKSGVAIAIPVSPNLRLIFTMILFFEVKFFLGLLVAVFFSFNFLKRLIKKSLNETNINTPTNPPIEVTTTASKTEKPKLNAIGTEPNTNLIVLNKNTEIISQMLWSTTI